MTSDEETLSPDDRDFVTALASGLEVILAFDEAHPHMTLSEVANRTPAGLRYFRPGARPGAAFACRSSFRR